MRVETVANSSKLNRLKLPVVVAERNQMLQIIESLLLLNHRQEISDIF
jgi:hypothetical protein